MKKIFCTLLAYVFCLGVTSAQDFSTYFTDRTLRINYLHIGNGTEESLEIDHYTAGGIWSGTRAYLIEPNNYGDLTLEVFDSTSNKLIYSRSYSNLFIEYRTTERGKTEIDSMEECVNMPFPKNTVRLKFTSFDRNRKPTTLSISYFNPKTTECTPVVKYYKTLNLHVGNKPSKAIDILFIPDGYAQSDKKLLKYDMKRFASYVMNCSPYKEMKKKVNIRAIMGFSEESGITQPQNNIYRNTLLNCTYNALDLDRYLMCPGVWNLHEVADDAPYDAIVIICNSERILDNIISLFYPRLCAACGNALQQHEQEICLPCMLHLPETNYHLDHDNPLREIFAGRVKVEEVAALMFYKKGNRVPEGYVLPSSAPSSRRP